MVFIDGFETGDLSSWSVAQTGGGDLRASTSAALDGVYGLEAVINDRTNMYLQDDRPAAEPYYRVRFKFDPNSIVMANNNVHDIFRGFSGTTNTIAMIFGYRNNEYYVQIGVLNDSGGWYFSSRLPIIDAVHLFEFDWLASTGAGANNGSTTFRIDGVQRFSLTGIDNDTQRVDMSRIGPLAGIDVGTKGTYYLDTYESLR